MSMTNLEFLTYLLHVFVYGGLFLAGFGAFKAIKSHFVKPKGVSLEETFE